MGARSSCLTARCGTAGSAAAVGDSSAVFSGGSLFGQPSIKSGASADSSTAAGPPAGNTRDTLSGTCTVRPLASMISPARAGRMTALVSNSRNR